MAAAKRLEGFNGEPETMARLPEELVLEILTWIPARELNKCNCVCKLWKSLIGSTPFLPLYRRRNPCLVSYSLHNNRLQFEYSPIWPRRWRTEDYNQNLRRLWSFPKGRNCDPLTQPVNGVICQGKGAGDNVQLTIYSICTGQGLQIPSPSIQSLDPDTESLYNLGYDPISRRYKLLRFIFVVDEEGRVLPDHRMRGEIITLGPTGTVWEWRNLDEDDAGMRRLPVETLFLKQAVEYYGSSMFSGDGALCWIYKSEGMILFDMHTERFRWVKLPLKLHIKEINDRLVPRVCFNENPLVVHLWVLPAKGDKFKPELERFCSKDGDGKVWKKRSEALPPELRDLPIFVNGSLQSTTGSSIMLVNSSVSKIRRKRELYCTNGMKKFWVGMPPLIWKSDDFSNQQLLTIRDGKTKLHLLSDSNVLYLPLRDVLDGNGLV